MESSRSNQSVQPKSETLIKVINKIFKLKGDPRRVKNIGQDFADGSKFSLSDFTPVQQLSSWTYLTTSTMREST